MIFERQSPKCGSVYLLLAELAQRIFPCIRVLTECVCTYWYFLCWDFFFVNTHSRLFADEKRNTHEISTHTNTIAFPSVQLQIPDMLSKKNCFDILRFFWFLLIYFNFVLCFTGVFTVLLFSVCHSVSRTFAYRDRTHTHFPNSTLTTNFRLYGFPFFSLPISCHSSFLHRCYTPKFQISLKLCLLFDNSIQSSAHLNLNLSYF